MVSSKRIRNPQLTRAKIIDATLELVAEKGVEALSMKEAAKRAGVSRSVAYMHFDDRNHLLNVANSTVSERLMSEMISFDPKDSLDKRIFNLATVILENPEAAKILLVDSLNGTRLDKKDPLFSTVYNILAELQKLGIFSAEADLEVSAYIQLSTIMTVLLLREQDKDASAHNIAERYTKEWSRILRTQYSKPQNQ
jgi:AcrR family transcriptional regulator